MLLCVSVTKWFSFYRITIIPHTASNPIYFDGCEPQGLTPLFLSAIYCAEVVVNFLNRMRDDTACCSRQGGRTCLPKFKFSAKFPICLHVILQIQIKQIQICLTSYHENYFKRKAVGVEHRTPL